MAIPEPQDDIGDPFSLRPILLAPFMHQHPCSTTTVANGILTRTFYPDKLASVHGCPTDLESDFHRANSSANPFLVPFTVFKRDENISLSRRFVSGQMLSEFLRTHPELELRQGLSIIWRLALAIRSMHANGRPLVLLRPSNIILTEVDGLVLVDCGLPSLKADLILSASAASVTYLGPEGGCGDLTPTLEVDIWNFGVIIYAIVTGELPFFHGNLPQWCMRVSEGNFEIDVHDIQHAGVRGLLQRIFQKCPADRPGIDEIIIEIDSWRGLGNEKLRHRLSDQPTPSRVMPIPDWPVPGVIVRRRTRSVVLNTSPVPRVTLRPRASRILLRVLPKVTSRTAHLRPGTSMPS
jgi:serine/threonine protein kinase